MIAVTPLFLGEVVRTYSWIVVLGNNGFINSMLLKFGLIPEFIGRLPVMSAVHQLSRDDLITILTEPRNALVKQYQKLFELDGVELEFTQDAIQGIADKAKAGCPVSKALTGVDAASAEDLPQGAPRLVRSRRADGDGHAADLVCLPVAPVRGLSGCCQGRLADRLLAPGRGNGRDGG